MSWKLSLLHKITPPPPLDFQASIPRNKLLRKCLANLEGSLARPGEPATLAAEDDLVNLDFPPAEDQGEV